MRRLLPSEVALVDELMWTMRCSPAPLAELLVLAVRCLGADPPVSGAAVLSVDVQTRVWSVLATTSGVDHQIAVGAATRSAQLRDWYRGLPQPEGAAPFRLDVEPVEGGSGSAIALYAGGRLTGALIVLGCTSGRWSTVPRVLANTVTLVLATAVTGETQRASTAFAQRSATALRRLFVQGVRAVDTDEAAAVLARAVAQALQTERTGLHLVNAEGIIVSALGVGLSSDLTAALAVAMLGKVAAESPAWQSLQLTLGASVVDDVDVVAVRPGGFVHTLGVVSYAVIPLLSKSGLLGMVISGDVTPRTWSSAERELADQFALEGGLIIDAARLRTSERAQLEQITYQAHHDELTGVPNRARLIDAVEHAVATAAAAHTAVAMLLLDLDEFKQVNDTYGHHVGDELLREVARRLKTAMRDGDLVARLGGDEFAILICGDGAVGQAQAVAAEVAALLSAPVIIGDLAINAGASIGIALFPDHTRDAAGLLRHADIAMYAAKRSGTGPTVYDWSHEAGTGFARRRTRDLADHPPSSPSWRSGSGSG